LQKVENQFFSGRCLRCNTGQSDEKILLLCREFSEVVLTKIKVTRNELLSFCRSITPSLKENLHNAAIIRIQTLHEKVMKFKDTLSEEQWSDMKVVILGPHMPRRGNLLSQYFARLLNISEDEDKKLIYCEGLADQESALDLLAINITDTEASVAFFEDPEYMHHDLLSSPTQNYLEKLFQHS